jgi:hypothetical protein
MLRDKKGFLFSKLNSCLAFAMCLIMGLPQAFAGNLEFLSNPSGLFQNSKADQCSIVNTHRTAMIPLPLDLELLKKTYLLPVGVK